MSFGTDSVRRTRRADEETALMAEEVRKGLTSELPTIPCKYFYDDHGSALFEEITELAEYYLTRTEEGILAENSDRIVSRVEASELVELGSGAGRKTRLLLDAMSRAGRLERCVLLDINQSFLSDSVARLQGAYPKVEIEGLVADFLLDFGPLGAGGSRLMLFLASTVGNLHPEERAPFFARAASVLATGDAFLVGVDLVKDKDRLEAAYNDRAGVTARFNLNVLQVLNTRLGADFDLGAFEHVAFYDAKNAWIEMRLRARRGLRVRIPAAGLSLSLEKGEEIRTELSCKFTRDSLVEAIGPSGLRLDDWLQDKEALFALALLKKT
jgi:L-histidine N-alpha-methyltransferase